MKVDYILKLWDGDKLYYKIKGSSIENVVDSLFRDFRENEANRYTIYRIIGNSRALRTSYKDSLAQKIATCAGELLTPAAVYDHSDSALLEIEELSFQACKQVLRRLCIEKSESNLGTSTLEVNIMQGSALDREECPYSRISLEFEYVPQNIEELQPYQMGGITQHIKDMLHQRFNMDCGIDVEKEEGGDVVIRLSDLPI